MKRKIADGGIDMQMRLAGKKCLISNGKAIFILSYGYLGMDEDAVMSCETNRKNLR